MSDSRNERREPQLQSTAFDFRNSMEIKTAGACVKTRITPPPKKKKETEAPWLPAFAILLVTQGGGQRNRKPKPDVYWEKKTKNKVSELRNPKIGG